MSHAWNLFINFQTPAHNLFHSPWVLVVTSLSQLAEARNSHLIHIILYTWIYIHICILCILYSFMVVCIVKYFYLHDFWSVHSWQLLYILKEEYNQVHILYLSAAHRKSLFGLFVAVCIRSQLCYDFVRHTSCINTVLISRKPPRRKNVGSFKVLYVKQTIDNFYLFWKYETFKAKKLCFLSVIKVNTFLGELLLVNSLKYVQM